MTTLVGFLCDSAKRRRYTWSRLMTPVYLAMTLAKDRDGNLDPSNSTLKPSVHPPACHDRDFPRISPVRAVKWSSHAENQTKANDGGSVALRVATLPTGRMPWKEIGLTSRASRRACTCNRSREFSLWQMRLNERETG